MGLIDEVRDHDPDTVADVVIPLMNVTRRMRDGNINKHEPQPQQLWMSSASSKSSYCYQQLIELLEQSIINPKENFIFGCDYRVPMMHGLLDKNYINSVKMSSTFKDDSFAREYLGRFTGATEDAWFNYDKLSKYRTLINPELSQKIRAGEDVFYLIAVDVGRYSCQTVATVFKVFRRTEAFYIRVVNIQVIGAGQVSHHFNEQAIELKRMINMYNPLEIVIDGNGLGSGLMDFMVLPTVDGDTVHPAYCAFNDDDYSSKLYPQAIPIIYNLKNNATLDSKIHANCYTMLNSGKIAFLAREQEIKNKLLGTKVGQKMSIEKRAQRLMPHEITTRLFEEMANLRLKQSGVGLEIKLERTNTQMGKDKFSSFEYGLWRIKELEEQYYTKKRRKTRNGRKLTFYTSRGV